MRATVMYGAGDVRIETVPDARADRTDRRASSSSAAPASAAVISGRTRLMEAAAIPAAAWDTRRSASSKPSAPTFAP